MTEAELESYMEVYAGKNFRKRQHVVEEIIDGGSGDSWTYKEMMEALESVPVEYRDVTEIAVEGDYDEGPRFYIRYYRDETDDEYNKRMERIRARALSALETQLQNERQIYERLKAKFEG